MLIITALEQAVKDVIHSLNIAGLRCIKSYGGQLEGDKIPQAIGEFPAVYVAFDRATQGAKLSARKTRLNLNMLVYMCVRDTNEESARHGRIINGQVHSLGTNVLAEYISRALIGKQLGTADAPFEFVSLRQVVNGGQGCCIAALELSTKVVYTNASDDDCAADLTSITIDYTVDNGGEQPVIAATDLVVKGG
jgi:phage gp37-like protein